MPTSTTISLPADATVHIWDQTDTIITATIKDDDGDGDAVDLTNAEVVCQAGPPAEADSLEDLTVTVADDPTGGGVSIAIPAGTFAPGTYEAQVMVTFPAGHADFPSAVMAAQAIKLVVRRQITVPAAEV